VHGIYGKYQCSVAKFSDQGSVTRLTFNKKIKNFKKTI
jgi:hypothetical protein